MADPTLAQLLQQEDPAAFYKSQRNHAYGDAAMNGGTALGAGAIAAMLAWPGAKAALLPMGAVGRYLGAPSMGMIAANRGAASLDDMRRAQLYGKIAEDTPKGAEGGIPTLPGSPY